MPSVSSGRACAVLSVPTASRPRVRLRQPSTARRRAISKSRPRLLPPPSAFDGLRRAKLRRAAAAPTQNVGTACAAEQWPQEFLFTDGAKATRGFLGKTCGVAFLAISPAVMILDIYMFVLLPDRLAKRSQRRSASHSALDFGVAIRPTSQCRAHPSRRRLRQSPHPHLRPRQSREKPLAPPAPPPPARCGGDTSVRWDSGNPTISAAPLSSRRRR